ncbi:MAG: hypothetical protein C4527_22710 [Candidatus Omnitrophota bacterium]|jgi:hypothetical protein|nr:MAG: hypothetical protein C4527_22710 [Candidatus Omnitrophota bacterium]
MQHDIVLISYTAIIPIAEFSGFEIFFKHPHPGIKKLNIPLDITEHLFNNTPMPADKHATEHSQQE